jgi:hypothetical protein
MKNQNYNFYYWIVIVSISIFAQFLQTVNAGIPSNLGIVIILSFILGAIMDNKVR